MTELQFIEKSINLIRTQHNIKIYQFIELDKVDDYWIRNLYKEFDREDKLKQLGI